MAAAPRSSRQFGARGLTSAQRLGLSCVYRASTVPAPPFNGQIAQRRPPVTFKLPELPYAYDALGPYMSKETLEFHHDKHHQAYVDNGNKVAGAGSKYEGKSIEDICKAAFAPSSTLRPA